jgi:cell division protein FtsB
VRGLDYSRLVPVLIQGTKEQQAQIRRLRRQNAQLSARMMRLERLVERRNR